MSMRSMVQPNGVSLSGEPKMCSDCGGEPPMPGQDLCECCERELRRRRTPAVPARRGKAESSAQPDFLAEGKRLAKERGIPLYKALSEIDRKRPEVRRMFIEKAQACNLDP